MKMDYDEYPSRKTSDRSTPLGLDSGVLHLSPYHAEWPILYESEQEIIKSAIGDHIVDIQHVGSTAIVGMPAKPILDIAIAVDDFETARVCIAPLANLGYTFKGENDIPRRHYFQKGEPCTHHIHMVEETSEEWTKLIQFRDYLRSNRSAARKYARLKADLIDSLAGDRKSYQAAKSDFIDGVVEKARATGK